MKLAYGAGGSKGLTVDAEDPSFVGDVLQQHHLGEDAQSPVFQSTMDVLVELVARQRWRK